MRCAIRFGMPLGERRRLGRSVWSAGSHERSRFKVTLRRITKKRICSERRQQKHQSATSYTIISIPVHRPRVVLTHLLQSDTHRLRISKVDADERNQTETSVHRIQPPTNSLLQERCRFANLWSSKRVNNLLSAALLCTHNEVESPICRRT